MDFVSTLVRLFKGRGAPKGMSFRYAERIYPIEEVGADFVQYRTNYGVEKLHMKSTSYKYQIHSVKVVNSCLVGGRRRIVIDIRSG